MATKKPTPDYLNLPFEVHFPRMGAVSFELVHKPGKPPKKLKDYKVIEQREGDVFDLTFRCENPKNGSLVYVMRGNLDEYIPDWMEKISDEDGLEINWARRSKFRIHNGALYLDEDDDNDYEDYDYGNTELGTFDYKAEGFKPDYLIVDADGSRVKIDLDGYKLNANNKRIGKTPVVTYTEEQAYDYDLLGRDDWGILVEVGGWFA